MKWFEHQADAAENKKIRKIEAWGAKLNPEYGAMAAVGWYFRLLEVITRHGRVFRLPDDYGLDLLTQDLRTSEETMMPFLNLLAEINAIDRVAWLSRVVFCPKLAKRADRYSEELIKKEVDALLGSSEKTISYELYRTIEILAQHPDPRKRKSYGQILCRLEGFSRQAPHSQCTEPCSLRTDDTHICAEPAHICSYHTTPYHTTQTREASASVADRATLVDDAAPPPDPVDSVAVNDGEPENEPQPTQKKFGPAGLVKLWNDMGCKPKVSELTDERRKKAGLRLRKRGDPEWWRGLFEKVRVLNKPWLTFDFLMRSDTNCLKVLEGNYDHDFGTGGNGGKDRLRFGAHQKPDRAHPRKYAAIGRTFATDPGTGGAGSATDSPGQEGVPGPPEGPA
ncbi:MAG: hypothetical protein PHU44_01355 [Syntrophales bacterium]|nr:hypothetical protein [Syntrophales bacterium]MDD5641085.1 hypothetical protein [Syntrophales bacterium]